MYKYLSSSIDWCENNFTLTDYIAETMNTFSAFYFFIICHRIYKKCNKLTRYIEYQLYNVFLVGLFSIYFHGTLSKLGQLLDEMSIFVLVLVNSVQIITNFSFNSYTHKKYMSIEYLYLYVLSVLFFMTIYPAYNRFILVFIGSIILIFINMAKMSNDLAISNRLFVLSFIIWTIDIICFLPISIHWIFHILIAEYIYILAEYVIKLESKYISVK